VIILVSHLSLSNIAEAETQHPSVLCPHLLSGIRSSLLRFGSLIRERVGCLAPHIKASIGTLSERDVRMKFTIAQLQQCRHLASEDMPKIIPGAIPYNICLIFYGRRAEKAMLQAAPLRRSIHREESNQETR
jgi:hypothetical protein